MRLLLLGVPRKSQDGWHDHIAQDAVGMGWDVKFVPIAKQSTDAIVRASRDADMVLWTYAHGHMPIGNAEEMLNRIHDNGTVTVGLHLDIYWGIARESRIGKIPWWKCQYVYTADGGQRNWKSKEVDHYWCPPAFGMRNLGLERPIGKHRYVFAGCNIRSIHGDHRSKLLAWAKRTYKSDFHWYGATTQSRVYGKELSQIVSYANVTLGDSAPAPYYWSDRVVHIMGRGGVLAHPRVEGLKEQGFTDDCMITFDRYRFDQINDRVQSLCGRDIEQMRYNAIDVVESRHMWRHRLEMFAQNAGLL